MWEEVYIDLLNSVHIKNNTLIFQHGYIITMQVFKDESEALLNAHLLKIMLKAEQYLEEKTSSKEGFTMEWKKLYDEGFNSVYIKENKVIAIEFGKITMKQYESLETAQYEANFLKFALETMNDINE